MEKELLTISINGLIQEMKSVVIQNDENYKFLDEWRKKNKQTQKIVNEAFEPERLKTKAAYDIIIEERRKYLNLLEESDKIVSKKMTDYITEKERIRRAEVQRIEAEQRKKAEDDRLVQAQLLSSMGREEKADELLDKRIITKKVEVPVALGKTMEKWIASVEKVDIFLKFACDSPEYLQYITIDINGLARLVQKNKGLTVPGIKIDQVFVPVA